MERQVYVTVNGRKYLLEDVKLLSTYSDSKEDQKPSYLLRQHILTVNTEK